MMAWKGCGCGAGGQRRLRTDSIDRYGKSMKNAPKAAVARAAMAAFEPLADLFVELGVSSPEAESLLRSVLVHGVLRRELEAGKRANHSRIALLTGVHRNEVKRILSAPPRIDPERETSRHRANRILAAWHE